MGRKKVQVHRMKGKSSKRLTRGRGKGKKLAPSFFKEEAKQGEVRVHRTGSEKNKGTAKIQKGGHEDLRQGAEKREKRGTEGLPSINDISTVEGNSVEDLCRRGEEKKNRPVQEGNQS